VSLETTPPFLSKIAVIALEKLKKKPPFQVIEFPVTFDKKEAQRLQDAMNYVDKDIKKLAVLIEDGENYG
jgi:hypothetical protein